MHQPGYIQEGQGVIFGYLLLGIYYRRIPGETVLVNCSTARGRGSSERMMEQVTAAATGVEKTSAL
jgi:hypothetical protein